MPTFKLKTGQKTFLEISTLKGLSQPKISDYYKTVKKHEYHFMCIEDCDCADYLQSCMTFEEREVHEQYLAYKSKVESLIKE